MAPPELDHRVANSLQLAVDFLLFEQGRLAEPAARRALIDAAERLVAVGHLHRFLCAHDGDHEVDLQPFPEVESVKVTGAAAQQLGLLVNELAINAAKHAYPMGEPGDVTIQGWHEGGRLRLSVADRGAGLPLGFDPMSGDGLGLEIVRRILRQLDGALHVETDGGARFVLTLPLPSPARPVRSFAPR
jgi:two-component sensor histidine kinase